MDDLRWMILGRVTLVMILESRSRLMILVKVTLD